MIRHSVLVLPINTRPIQISTIRLNGEVQTQFNHAKRFITMKRHDDMSIYVELRNMKTFETVFADEENLCLEAYEYEESTKNYTKKMTKFKQNGGRIKPKSNQSGTKIKLLLSDRKKVIDYCLIDIV